MTRCVLPYWDYTNTTYLGMPAEFTPPTYVDDKGNTPAQSALRAAAVFPAGRLPPRSHSTAPTPTSTDALGIDSFFDTTVNNKPVPGYQSTIENAPHGYVHCAVMDCPTVVMGAVPYSSNDPIFWLHHCNIDRTWTCWTSISGHNNPSQSWFRNKKFSYVNEKGLKVDEGRERTLQRLTDRLRVRAARQTARAMQFRRPPRRGSPDDSGPGAVREDHALEAARPRHEEEDRAQRAHDHHGDLRRGGHVEQEDGPHAGDGGPRFPQLPVVANLVLRGIPLGPAAPLD
jgi:hypothetical protein